MASDPLSLLELRSQGRPLKRLSLLISFCRLPEARPDLGASKQTQLTQPASYLAYLTWSYYDNGSVGQPSSTHSSPELEPTGG